MPFGWRDTEATSIDWDLMPGSGLTIWTSLLGGSGLLVPHDANMDWLSSIGVKM